MHGTIDQMKFFSEMMEHQTSAREFFGDTLINSLERNFGLHHILISYFDLKGRFLSWVGKDGLLLDSEEHPYRAFFYNDVVRNTLYQEAVRDRLTYFNVEPRMCKSTDIISVIDYETSAYVRFLEEQFDSHYSATLAFGMNAYIQVSFFKTREQGDFTEEEMEVLQQIYIFVANAYKNFKMHEQSQIISNIQSRIIETGEKAFLVTDEFKHVLMHNEQANLYLQDVFGSIIPDEISSVEEYHWLSVLLGNEWDEKSDLVIKRMIQNYVFKIHQYNQMYSNKIVDAYYWITIRCTEEKRVVRDDSEQMILTKTELKVAELMYNGLTYKDIAKEMVISYHTVKNHVQNIYTKCQVNSRYELYNWLDGRGK